MKMYNGQKEIDVHPTRIEYMTRLGWTDTKPSQAKPKKGKSKAVETIEEIDNGKS